MSLAQTLAVADPSELDEGLRTTRSAAQRMCALTRIVRPVDELLRFVLSPHGEPVVDLKRRLPGRGLWISAAHASVAEAARKNVFARGFKKPVKPSPNLADVTGALLVRGVLDALAMVAKAGQVVSGFAKVEAALTRHEAVALIHASDGAADGIRKLDAIARQNAGADAISVVTILGSDELDLALGRSNVIHAALLAGAASKTFLSRCRILVRYRMIDGAAAGASATDSD